MRVTFRVNSEERGRERGVGGGEGGRRVCVCVWLKVICQLERSSTSAAHDFT